MNVSTLMAFRRELREVKDVQLMLDVSRAMAAEAALFVSKHERPNLQALVKADVEWMTAERRARALRDGTICPHCDSDRGASTVCPCCQEAVQ